MGHVRRVVVVGLVLLAGSAWAQENKPVPIESYVPSSPILYVYYQGLGGASTSFRKTALHEIVNEGEVQEFGKELSRFIDRQMKDHAGNFPLTWPDIRMLLDCEMGYALLDVQARMPQMLLVIRGGAHIDAVRALQDRLVARAMRDAPPDQPVPEGDMDGIRYQQLGPLCICWMGGDLIVTSGPGTLRRVVRTIKGFDPSVAQDARFKEVSSKTMGGKEFLMAHFSVETLVAQVLPEGADAPPRPKWFKTVGAEEIASVHLAIAPDPPGLKTMLYVHAPRGRQGVLRLLQTQPIDEKTMLARVSAEATDFVAARCSLTEVYDVLARVLADAGEEQDFRQGMAKFKEKVGFDLRGELLAALGDELLVQSIGPGYSVLPEFYLSVGVRDEAALRKCLDRLLAVASEELAKAVEAGRGARGGPRPGLEVEKLDYKGQAITAVKITGVPVPLTPSFAVVRNRFIVALLPQTLKKAIDLDQAQVQPITEAAGYAAVRAHVAKKPTVLGYSEFKRGFDAAYSGVLTHLVQVLNGVPGLPPHSLGTKFPSSNAIVPHLFASVEVLSYDGEGFLFEGYGPFGGGTAPPGGGGGGGSVATMGIMAGFLLPALAKSQEAARRAACMNNTRQIGLAMIQYAGDHDDKFPESLGVLLKEGYLTTPKVFLCPSGRHGIPPGFPGDFRNADLAVLNQVEEFGDYVVVKGITHAADADFIVIYEKDGAHGGQGRNCFHNDGHIRWYPEFQFQEAIGRQRERMGRQAE